MNVNHDGYSRRLDRVRDIFGGLQANILEIVPVAYNEKFPFPFNNYLYKVTLHNPICASLAGVQCGTTAAPADADTFIMRLGSLEADGLNNENRIQNEVASSMLARQALVAAGLGRLVPDIYAWAPPTSLESTEEKHFGWIISEYKNGSDLDKCFPTLSNEKQTEAVAEMAAILWALQNATLPLSVTQVGGITFDETGTMVSGKSSLTEDGPWPNFADIWISKLRKRLVAVTDDAIRAAPADNQIFQRIEAFISNGGIQKLLSGLGATRCLVHGDFTMNNMLYDINNGRITALLDFDFSRVSHPVEEYQMGLYDMGHSMLDHPSGIWPSIVANNFNSQPSGLKEEDRTLWNRATQWNSIAREKGVLVPGDIDGIGQLKKLEQLSHMLASFETGGPAATGDPSNGDDDETKQKRQMIVKKVVDLMNELGM